MKNMKLTYTKISANLYKFFSEDGGYGEFYMYIEPSSPLAKHGKAEIQHKDPEYGPHLVKKFAEAVLPNLAEIDKLDWNKIDGINRSYE